MKKVAINRKMQFWKYDVSHSRALLLSPKNDEFSSRLIILFKAVDKLCLKSTFFCKEILWEEGSSERNRYVIKTNSDELFVCSLAMFLDEDELDYDAPIPLMEW